MKYSVNIETVYQELPFADRFAAAKRDGFDFVELWDWTVKDLDEVAALCRKNGVQVSCMGGDGPISLCDVARGEEYLAFLRRSLAAAQKIGCKLLAVHSNELMPEPHPYAADTFPQYSDAEKTQAMIRTLSAIATEAEAAGVTLCLEALNVKVEHIGNFLRYTKDAADIVRAVGSPNVRILFDAYHMYLNDEDIFASVEAYHDLFGCVHIADAPGRGEPGTGEIDYPALLKKLKDCGYDGMAAFELFPKTDSAAAVEAMRNICI